MYRPTHFIEDRLDVQIALMGQHPLAAIVRNTADGLEAEHIPLMHEAATGGPGKLIGHVAKGNPLWRCSPTEKILAIFQGPSAYISPGWYASKRETGRVVPTWNYAVVHAHCTLTAIRDPARVLQIIAALTDRHESARELPWRVADAPAAFTRQLVDNIVGIELAIHRIHGKWKVSQNQPAANRASVVQGLLAQGGDAGVAMAQLVDSHATK